MKLWREAASALTIPAVEPRDRYANAITLFELQVSFVGPGKTKRIRQGGRLAVVKLLESVEARLKRELGHAPSLSELSQSEEYSFLHEEFQKRGGFEALRHTVSVRSFAKKIKTRLEEAKPISTLIDISLRFNKADITTRDRGGITSATSYYLESTHEDESPPGRTKLTSLWREHERSAVWLYLLHCQRFELMPPRLTSRRFAETLLEQTDDTEHLVEFFSAYNAASADLRTKGYTFPELPNGQLVPFELPLTPLDPTVLSALRWRN